MSAPLSNDFLLAFAIRPQIPDSTEREDNGGPSNAPAPARRAPEEPMEQEEVAPLAEDGDEDAEPLGGEREGANEGVMEANDVHALLRAFASQYCGNQGQIAFSGSTNQLPHPPAPQSLQNVLPHQMPLAVMQVPRPINAQRGPIPPLLGLIQHPYERRFFAPVHGPSSQFPPPVAQMWPAAALPQMAHHRPPQEDPRLAPGLQQMVLQGLSQPSRPSQPAPFSTGHLPHPLGFPMNQPGPSAPPLGPTFPAPHPQQDRTQRKAKRAEPKQAQGGQPKGVNQMKKDELKEHIEMLEKRCKELKDAEEKKHEDAQREKEEIKRQLKEEKEKNRTLEEQIVQFERARQSEVAEKDMEIREHVEDKKRQRENLKKFWKNLKARKEGSRRKMKKWKKQKKTLLTRSKSLRIERNSEKQNYARVGAFWSEAEKEIEQLSKEQKEMEKEKQAMEEENQKLKDEMKAMDEKKKDDLESWGNVVRQAQSVIDVKLVRLRKGFNELLSVVEREHGELRRPRIKLEEGDHDDESSTSTPRPSRLNLKRGSVRSRSTPPEVKRRRIEEEVAEETGDRLVMPKTEARGKAKKEQ